MDDTKTEPVAAPAPKTLRERAEAAHTRGELRAILVEVIDLLTAPVITPKPVATPPAA